MCFRDFCLSDAQTAPSFADWLALAQRQGIPGTCTLQSGLTLDSTLVETEDLCSSLINPGHKPLEGNTRSFIDWLVLRQSLSIP